MLTLLITSKEGGKSFCPCLFVCLSVSLLARLLKNACMDLDEMLRVDWDVGTWTNWLTFEPDSDPDYSPDAGTGLLSPILYKRCYAEFYIGKIPRIRISGAPLQWGVVLKWFYSLSRGNTFVSTECPSSFFILFYQSLKRSIAYACVSCEFRSHRIRPLHTRTNTS